jgi:hypothetical protein
MKRRLALMMAVAGLGACTMSGSPIDSHRYEVALDVARDDAAIDCVGQVVCDAMWQRTREFVKQHSVTNIIRANKTVIETAEPHESGVLYLWASRTLMGDGTGSSTIRVKGLCRGMYTTDGNPAWMYVTCAELITHAEREFRQFSAGADPGKGAVPE